MDVTVLLKSNIGVESKQGAYILQHLFQEKVNRHSTLRPLLQHHCSKSLPVATAVGVVVGVDVLMGVVVVSV